MALATEQGHGQSFDIPVDLRDSDADPENASFHPKTRK
jgi:hypothetical protein